jgi:hypothetical protein
MKVIAIDPGASGGIAWSDEVGQVQCCPMPETEGDVVAKLREIGFLGSRFVIEEVGGYIGKPTPGSAMFNFGYGAGFIAGIIMGYGCPLKRSGLKNGKSILG